MASRIEQSNKDLAAILSLKEVATLVVRHKRLHDGLFNLVFQFQIGVGAVGPTPETLVPGAIFGVAGVGLEKVEIAGPQTIDAAIVNPAPTKLVKQSPAKNASIKRAKSAAA